MVSLAQHGTSTTLPQTAVARKRNQIAAVLLLLAGRNLTDAVTTLFAFMSA